MVTLTPRAPSSFQLPTPPADVTDGPAWRDYGLACAERALAWATAQRTATRTDRSGRTDVAPAPDGALPTPDTTQGGSGAGAPTAPAASSPTTPAATAASPPAAPVPVAPAATTTTAAATTATAAAPSPAAPAETAPAAPPAAGPVGGPVPEPIAVELYDERRGRIGRPARRARPAPPTRTRRLEFVAYREASPGRRWRQLFRATWPSYRAWFTQEPMDQRPTLTEAREQLERHMPELVPTWQRLVELTGKNELAARMLTMWRMPAYIAGCSQVLTPAPAPMLIRNYDYDPRLFEGVLATTNYSGSRQVIGTSDMLWGLLDGMNEDGLVVSLTYGGRSEVGDGFAIPIVLRYLLETCADVPAAVRTLQRLPVAQAYNVALLDRSGAHATVFVAPGEPADVSDLRVSTNHRLEEVEHPLTAHRILSPQRQQALSGRLCQFVVDGQEEPLVRAFLTVPVRSQRYDAGFGTLYTVVYRPEEDTVTYYWPGHSRTRGFADGEDAFGVDVEAA